MAMRFKNDLFISYSHLDNEEGWVTLLHEKLAPRIEFYLGEKTKIWRDEKLNGNDDFSKEILDRIKDVALMISVLSPRYVRSEWCQKEASAFCQAAEATGGIEVANKYRVFKVYQLPLHELPGLPDVFSKALGFEFYDEKAHLRLDPTLYGRDIEVAFNLQVARLADQIAETVKILEGGNQEQKTGPTVYLGYTGWDRQSDRKSLEIELSKQGCVVLPRKDLAQREDECAAEITRLLDSCTLAIHIMDNKPGMVPYGPSQKSVDQLQNELAAKQSKARALPRKVWLPAGTKSENPEHQEFLVALTRSEDALLGADVVTGDFECFKGVVLGALQKIKDEEAAAHQTTGGGTGKLIFVICDARDVDATEKLMERLEKNGFEPQWPLFTGSDAGKVRQNNDRCLQECCAVLIYYGAGDQQWYESTMLEVKKAGRPVPVWTWLAEPVTRHKQKLGISAPNGVIVNGMGGLPEHEVDQMLSALQQRSAAAGAA